ncbi:MAG: branched-chain amino acid ABC transporter permease [Arenicellales bacterium]|nr:branched-chain amino acid ABC transporter permease [Arenicellales bacterium]
MNSLLFVLEDSLSGLMTGGVYALMAVGMVLVFKATRVVNFAHGAIMMVGTYFFFSMSAMAQALAVTFWVTVPLALIATGLLGALLERVLMRPLLGQSVFSMIMVTVGLISVLEGLAALIWTTEAQYPPALFTLEITFINGIAINLQMFWSFVVGVGVFILIAVALFLTRTGVALRATAFDQGTAYAMGINVPRVFSLTWMLASMTGCLAGLLLAPLNSLTPALGHLGLSVLAVIILGGLDSILGTLIAALLIGWLEAMAGHYLGGDWRGVMPYAVVLAIILVRPYGLFGTREVERL